MSFDRERTSMKGELTFECDECMTSHETGTTDFHEGFGQIKGKGWWTTKVGKEWLHFCGRDCYNAYQGKDS